MGSNARPWRSPGAAAPYLGGRIGSAQPILHRVETCRRLLLLLYAGSFACYCTCDCLLPWTSDVLQTGDWRLETGDWRLETLRLRVSPAKSPWTLSGIPLFCVLAQSGRMHDYKPCQFRPSVKSHHARKKEKAITKPGPEVETKEGLINQFTVFDWFWGQVGSQRCCRASAWSRVSCGLLTSVRRPSPLVT